MFHKNLCFMSALFSLFLLFSSVTPTLHAMNIDFGFKSVLEHSVSTLKYIHTGVVACVNSVVDAYSVTENGSVTASNKISIACSSYFGGSGTLNAPDVRIETNTFGFTGTIECPGTCEIISKKAFDKNMFTQKGGGRFIINGVEQGWRKYVNWVRNSSKSRNIVLGCLAATALAGTGYYAWKKYKERRKKTQQKPSCAVGVV